MPKASHGPTENQDHENDRSLQNRRCIQIDLIPAGHMPMPPQRKDHGSSIGHRPFEVGAQTNDRMRVVPGQFEASHENVVVDQADLGAKCRQWQRHESIREPGAKREQDGTRDQNMDQELSGSSREARGWNDGSTHKNTASTLSRREPALRRHAGGRTEPCSTHEHTTV